MGGEETREHVREDPLLRSPVPDFEIIHADLQVP